MTKFFMSMAGMLLLLFSCKDPKTPKNEKGFKVLDSATAKSMIRNYADPRVGHEYKDIIKSIQVHSAELSALIKDVDSVKFFAAADPADWKPTIIVQTIVRHSDPVYTYYMFETRTGTICPPPDDCYIELTTED